MFIRVKKISKYKYGYLVENTRKKGKTQQKVKKYLGRVYECEPTKPLILNDPSSVIDEFLTQLGFEKKGTYAEHDDIKYYYKSRKVQMKKKNIVLQINEGFFCQHTMTELEKSLTKTYTKNQKDIHELAHTLVNAGVRLEKESFILLFSHLANIEL